MEAIFNGENLTLLPTKQWQYDTGQALTISGIEGLNADSEIHFERHFYNDAIIKKGEYDTENNALTVEIPDEIFENAFFDTAKVWIYLNEGSGGKTVREFTIPIIKRAKPQDWISKENLKKSDVIYSAVAAYLQKNPLVLDEYYTKGEIDSTFVDIDEFNGELDDIDSEITAKADKSDTYTKAEVDAAIQTAIGGAENGSY